MEHIAKSIVVHVPIHAAYTQWTHFEEYPSFFGGVMEVRLIECARLHWRARVGGRTCEWEAIITHQIPDAMIAWRSISGPFQTTSIAFHTCGSEETRIEMTVEHESAGMIDRLGATLGIHEARLQGDLERFKRLIESRHGALST